MSKCEKYEHNTYPRSTCLSAHMLQGSFGPTAVLDFTKALYLANRRPGKYDKHYLKSDEKNIENDVRMTRRKHRTMSTNVWWILKIILIFSSFRNRWTWIDKIRVMRWVFVLFLWAQCSTVVRNKFCTNFTFQNFHVNLEIFDIRFIDSEIKDKRTVPIERGGINISSYHVLSNICEVCTRAYILSTCHFTEARAWRQM